MSSAPYMQLYVADYLGDTQHLTTEQHGAYLLILMAMWRAGGRLPNDPGKLARIARVSARRWHLVASEVMPFFDLDGEEISQKRLEREHQKVLSIREKRSASGALGGAAKALKNNDPALANAKQMPKHRARVPEPEPDKVSSKPIARARKHAWPSDYQDWFWRLYPKKTEKKAAMAALDREHGLDRTPWEVMVAGIERQISHVDPRFHPAAHRWLRDERWNDEHQPHGQTRAPPRRTFGDIAREGLEELERREYGNRHREADHDGPTLDFGSSGEGADQFDLQPAGRHGWS